MADTFQDDLLDKLVGNWRIVREFRNRTVENNATAEWVLNHQFLRVHMRDVTEPPRYEAMVFIGFNPTEQRYVGHWIDVFGGEFSETLGLGKRNGNLIEFTFQYPDSLLTNVFLFDAASGTWTSKIDQQDESGAFVPFCVDTYSRAG